MEQLKHMTETLTDCVATQIASHMDTVETGELGAAIDMIKDLSEAIYYCTITEAMEEKDKERRQQPMYMMMDSGKRPDYSRDMDKGQGRMYYDGNGNGNNGTSYYPLNMRDYREGRSPVSRKMYMESKEMHHDKAKQMNELEEYMHELSQDITEMIQDASQEEKQMLQQKLSALASKIK